MGYNAFSALSNRPLSAHEVSMRELYNFRVLALALSKKITGSIIAINTIEEVKQYASELMVSIWPGLQ